MQLGWRYSSGVLPTSCTGDGNDTAFMSCYPGRSELSSEADATESLMLPYVTPRNLRVHPGRHGCSHFLGLWWVSSLR